METQIGTGTCPALSNPPPFPNPNGEYHPFSSSTEIFPPLSMLQHSKWLIWSKYYLPLLVYTSKFLIVYT